MGYSTDPNASHEPLTLVQTPQNVKAVRLRAGYLKMELAEELEISTLELDRAESIEHNQPLFDVDWQRMLEICGRRVFDKE